MSDNRTTDFNADDYATGTCDDTGGPFFEGFGGAYFGKFTTENPYPPDTEPWREWLRGHEACLTAEWTTIEIPDDSPLVKYLPTRGRCRLG